MIDKTINIIYGFAGISLFTNGPLGLITPENTANILVAVSMVAAGIAFLVTIVYKKGKHEQKIVDAVEELQEDVKRLEKLVIDNGKTRQK